MKSLLISGISGKVGSYLLKLAKNYSFNVVCGVDRKTFSDADCPVYKTFSEVKENVDVVIDFSSPALTEQAIEFAESRKCPILSGTTALLIHQKTKLKKLSEKIPVCWSSNFSKTMIHFLQSAFILKQTLNDFDTILIEEHNKNKKDSPSGTANYLAEQLSIKQIHALRGGNIAGIHKIVFLGDGEEVELIHRAYDKSVFAKGALLCATNLLSKEKGFYTVSNLLIDKNQIGRASCRERVSACV